MAEDEILEASRIGEDAASKAVAPDKTGVGGSTPSASAELDAPLQKLNVPTSNRPYPKKSFDRAIKDASPVTLYRLNFRRINGEIRSDIPRGLVNSLISNWSDLLRIIPTNRWSSLEEIVQMVWEWEKRQYRLMYPPRSRPQIEKGVIELTEAGVLNTKS